MFPFKSSQSGDKKLKSSQKDSFKEFIALTQTGYKTNLASNVYYEILHICLLGEKTALYCLSQHDWKLDIALDNYFANPELYYREPRSVVDRKKLESVYGRLEY